MADNKQLLILFLLLIMPCTHMHGATNEREQLKIFAKGALKSTVAMGLWCAASKKMEPAGALFAVLLMMCADEYYVERKKDDQHKLLRLLGCCAPLMVFTNHCLMRELVKEKTDLKQQLAQARNDLSSVQAANSQRWPMFVLVIPELQTGSNGPVMPISSAPPLTVTRENV